MTKYILLLVSLSVLVACETEKTLKKSSAQPNVFVESQTFTINQLNRPRQLRIYLPAKYDNSPKRYPVLYMHDGQNLFDDSTSYANEWGVDETLNELSIDPAFEIIVVGIDNGLDKRMNELSPWENQEFGEAEGAAYVKFIVDQVKPFIDSTYRTLTDKENTMIAGSSMGGLISHYAINQYPAVFGKAGIFSPSYWYSNEVFKFVQENPIPKNSKLYMVVGKHEGGMVDDSQKMYDTLIATGHPTENVIFVIDQQGEHNEISWRKQFIPAIKWLIK